MVTYALVTVGERSTTVSPSSACPAITFPRRGAQPACESAGEPDARDVADNAAGLCCSVMPHRLCLLRSPYFDTLAASQRAVSSASAQSTQMPPRHGEEPRLLSRRHRVR